MGDIALCHQSDISTFLKNVMVYTMLTIYFLQAYHQGWPRGPPGPPGPSGPIGPPEHLDHLTPRTTLTILYLLKSIFCQILLFLKECQYTMFCHEINVAAFSFCWGVNWHKSFQNDPLNSKWSAGLCRGERKKSKFQKSMQWRDLDPIKSRKGSTWKKERSFSAEMRNTLVRTICRWMVGDGGWWGQPSGKWPD